MVNKDGFSLKFVDEYINECPHCNNGIKAEILSHYLEDVNRTTYVDVLGKCPVCKMIFWGKYSYEHWFDSFGLPMIINKATYYPQKINVKSFSDEIMDVSSQFVEQYHQAEAAEQLGFNDICGLAYRRAFEHLIKDFAITLAPNNRDEIIAETNLANVIGYHLLEKHLVKEINEIANKAWWLEKDYAAYTKSYDDIDIYDLKECITITQKYVELYLKYNYQVVTNENK